MSRYDRDPDRERQAAEERDQGSGRNDRTPEASTPWSSGRDLMLPRTPERQLVAVGDDRFHVRDSEAEMLATVGAFRVVPEHELLRTSQRDDQAANPRGNTHAADIRSLSEQGLLETRTIVINERPERVLVLTQAAEALLEAHRDPTRADDEPRQEYYAGVVKPRELAHDAQLYRLFQTEREQLEGEGASVTRVVLDYELKREYHTFVHEQQKDGVDATDARRAFADAHDLPFVRGHIELPDVRIEYEDPDGRELHRDLELATEHYSRSQLGGKHSAGFRVYRAAGARGAGAGKPGGSPIDPHHLEWLR
jgi:hypothetical protein